MSFIQATLNKLKSGLEKTRSAFASGFQKLLSSHREIDQELIEDLEALLLTADVGVEATDDIIHHLEKAYKQKEITEVEEIKPFLKDHLLSLVDQGDKHDIHWNEDGPTVFLVVGVNGSGKTTTIAKMAYRLDTEEDKSSILAAGDTFRAAAVDQLERWSQTIDTDIVKHQSGGDAGAVVYDAAEAALAREKDCLFVDTAGRLHTEKNLMKELGKIRRVLSKQIPNAPHETLLVLDATVGQNAIKQAERFDEFTDVTGIALAKLDGTAKGGVVIPIQQQMDIPVKFIGVGESKEDIVPFKPESYVEALLS